MRNKNQKWKQVTQHTHSEPHQFPEGSAPPPSPLVATGDDQTIEVPLTSDEASRRRDQLVAPRLDTIRNLVSGDSPTMADDIDGNTTNNNPTCSKVGGGP